LPCACRRRHRAAKIRSGGSCRSPAVRGKRRYRMHGGRRNPAPLRTAAERTVAGLWAAIGRCLDRFTSHECANYFAAAGYEPT
jgi:hypothetical protein